MIPNMITNIGKTNGAPSTVISFLRRQTYDYQRAAYILRKVKLYLYLLSVLNTELE